MASGGHIPTSRQIVEEMIIMEGNVKIRTARLEQMVKLEQSDPVTKPEDIEKELQAIQNLIHSLKDLELACRSYKHEGVVLRQKKGVDRTDSGIGSMICNAPSEHGETTGVQETCMDSMSRTNSTIDYTFMTLDPTPVASMQSDRLLSDLEDGGDSDRRMSSTTHSLLMNQGHASELRRRSKKSSTL